MPLNGTQGIIINFDGTQGIFSDDGHLKNLVLDIFMETQDNFDIIHNLERLNRHPDGTKHELTLFRRERENIGVFIVHQMWCTRHVI
jgi:hypothetical protein